MSTYNKDKYIAKTFKHDRSAFCADVEAFSRVYLIADAIAKGDTFRDIAKKYGEEWQVSPNYIRSIVTEAIALFQDKEYYDKIKDINNERLNNLYKQALDEHDLKSAIKAIDTLNRANGVYDQPKTTVNVQTADDSNITITFGGEAAADIVKQKPQDEVPFNEVNELINNALNNNEKPET